MNERSFLSILALLGGGLSVLTGPANAQVPGGTLDPTTIPKYVDPLVIPPAMPPFKRGTSVDYYDIAVRQFDQQILPAGAFPTTTVWGYGALNAPGTVPQGGTFNYPAFTIEAFYNRQVVVRWINDLIDDNGDYLPHLLPVDQTLHWANPVGPRDERGTDPTPYTGPVPMVVHVHGADTVQESDGYPEAWYLPNARNIPSWIRYRTGTFYDEFFKTAAFPHLWRPGAAVFRYPNNQRATTLWYHDHTLGMTRLNVYAGPAGFYLLRGGPGDSVRGTLPGPAPDIGDPPGLTYFEIPIAIQDRSFNDDGSLFYPDNRAFFEGLDPSQLQIPFIPDAAIGGPSDISAIWNPEFFANTLVVNGRTWPFLDVQRRRYRLRLLNGCNSRFLILKFEDGTPFWQIGADGGFLRRPERMTELLLGPAERADIIVDFQYHRQGDEVRLLNIGPDEPFGGGVPGVDFPVADPGTTGQVMLFRVRNATSPDPSTPPADLRLPSIPATPPIDNTRQVSLNEEVSRTVLVSQNANGNVVLDPNGAPFGPKAAILGTVNADGTGNSLLWSSPITELPKVGDTEIWEIENFTADAHPIHIHMVQFKVVEREDALGNVRPPEPGESGFKDTVVAYPGETTRIVARFRREGLFVWHCHILEHEDNEMMRPYRVVSGKP